MIEVNQLSKQYPGGLTAVREVSFSVDNGDVVGLLGPNGAGKSTIMRILSGFISPSAGEVRIKGMDVTRDSIEVRKRIGYLPENCPLYPEMRVAEYLRYRANIKRVSRRHMQRRLDQVMEQCDLGKVRRQLIGTLSKGFRQRVGIADALVHRPDLLILDEPTIGLDPHQIVQIRGLIQQLAKDHTVLISSHILSEIESTCNRAVVLYQGEIRDSGTLADLQARWLVRDDVRLEVKATAEDVQEALEGLEGLRERVVTEPEEGWCQVDLRMEPGVDPRERLFEMAVEKEWTLRELSRREKHLEEAYLSMTAKKGGEA